MIYNGAIPFIPLLVAPDESNLTGNSELLFRSVSKTTEADIKFICNKDGTYSILTGATDYKFCFTYNESTGTVSQNEYNGDITQKFILEPANPDDVEAVVGDVNNDGGFGVADLVMLERYLLGARDNLYNWQAGDLDNDGAITTYDLVFMRKLVKEN
jgi:arabinan endo-1,5-alpha-L-arabinosidase